MIRTPSSSFVAGWVSALFSGWRYPVTGLALVLLASCSGGANQPKPAQLKPLVPVVAVQQIWSARLGPVSFPMTVSASGNNLFAAASDGVVAAIDARTGRDIWRLNLVTPLAAGVGSDGRMAAVVTLGNELVAIVEGREIWREKLTAQAYTAPFVAGGRIFVLTADRAVHAFDGNSGRKLWTQQRPTEPLVLRQAGVLLAVGDTLVAGLAGRIAGLNPANGSLRWEVPIASPRGINDVERLVDLVGPVSRLNEVLCVRAFQASVGCVNADRGVLQWTKPADGSVGLDGDERLVFAVESDGKVVSWKRADGESGWSSDQLRYRGLTAPRVVGRSIAIGDASGFVHLLSREDGTLINRLTTDGSAIVATPTLVGETLVVVTRAGTIFGFQPQ
jgi:outer membrane protein assembly factor BamB